MNGSQLIVFEGISGAGKSTLINAMVQKLFIKKIAISHWFSLDRYRAIASEISNYQEMTANLYSLLYATEFYARYEYVIKQQKENGETCIAHRYIYTPFAHDPVRGTDQKFLEFLYHDVLEPDLIFFIDIDPELAYWRISSTRNPSFFEAGLDLEYRNNLSQGLKTYKEGYFTNQELKRRFLAFQSKIYRKYPHILPKKKLVIIPAELTIFEQLTIIENNLKGEKSEMNSKSSQ